MLSLRHDPDHPDWEILGDAARWNPYGGWINPWFVEVLGVDPVTYHGL